MDLLKNARDSSSKWALVLMFLFFIFSIWDILMAVGPGLLLKSYSISNFIFDLLLGLLGFYFLKKGKSRLYNLIAGWCLIILVLSYLLVFRTILTQLFIDHLLKNVFLGYIVFIYIYFILGIFSLMVGYCAKSVTKIKKK